MRRTALLLALVLLATAGSSAAMHAQQAGSRTTSFDHKTGNEWWVEAVVAGSPSKVEARDDGGAWTPLTLRSWGAWAASFHIEPGHRVQFRAAWSDGASVESCWFTHPAGEEQCAASPPPPPPPGAYAFDHKTGNEWWVEAVVKPEPVAVEAMDTNGAWVPLTKRSWGAWAGSFRIEPGHEVKFRAKGADGVWHESCWFSHPAGIERCEAALPEPSWPVEGSFVKYAAGWGEGVPGYANWADYNVTYTYSGGQWRVRCEGWEYEQVDEQPMEVTRIDNTSVVAAPPLNPTNVKPGQDGEVKGVHCFPSGARGTIFGPINAAATRNGSEVEATAYYTEYHPIWPQQTTGTWDARTGLTLSWSDGRSHSGDGGQLLDTDAPIEKLGPRTSWPFEGSYVKYTQTQGEYGWREWSNITFEFRDGGWLARCAFEWLSPEGERGGSSYETTLAPAHAPTDVRAGQVLDVAYLEPCQWRVMEVQVKGKFPEDTTRQGAPYRASVWWADEYPDDTTGDYDLDAWWDTATGLLVRWENQDVRGRLVDTDAPMARG